MKKNILIVLITLQLAMISSWAQDTEIEKKNKQPRFCAVKVTLMNDSVDRYALHRFSNDSMFVFKLNEEDGKKEIQLHRQVGIKAEAIKRIYIKIDRKITLAKAADQVEYIKASDSFAKKVNRINTGQEMTNLAYDQLFVFPGDPLTGLVSFGLGLIFGSNGKAYHIKGDQIKFNSMVKELTYAKND